MADINKIVVIGAGVMGAGIAAQIANAGIKVGLIDIVPEGARDRNMIAKAAISNFKKANPAPLMSAKNAKLITAGNIEDSGDMIAEADLIIEAVIEKIDIKQSLYQKIEHLRKDGSIVSSNTSTIPLKKLIDGQSERFQRDFMITHFFNPPRYMRLLELVSGDKTNPAAVVKIKEFSDVTLGKGVVVCHDRPGFIANRLGVYWLQVALHEALRLNITIEEADAIISKPFGIPKTGIFGLVDMVGLDLIPHINTSLETYLPNDDPFHAVAHTPDLIKTMISDGYTGRKGKGGFYRMARHGSKRVKEAINLKTGAYATADRPDLSVLKTAKGDIAKLLQDDSKYGTYARSVMGQTLSYAASLVGDAAGALNDIDDAMELGYNWQLGPFKLIDTIGADHLIDMLDADGKPIPAFLQQAKGRSFYRIDNGKRHALNPDGSYDVLTRPEGVLLLEDIKRTSEPILQNQSAALWDLGDGITCLEFTTKMNAIDMHIFALLEDAIKLVEHNHKAMILYNEGSLFSAGVNLSEAYEAMAQQKYADIDQLVARGQDVMQKLKYAPFPVIGAPTGMALGGGCEFLLHCDHIQAHAETYMGLVEVGVGVIPGWGGCKEMLGRFAHHAKAPKGPMPATISAFQLISTASVSTSALDAKDKGYLKPSDGITMNKNRLLMDAKQAALTQSNNYQVPEPFQYRVSGASGKALLDGIAKDFHTLGKATDYDLTVCDALSSVLSGGAQDVIDETSEADMLALERTNFAQLVQNQGTVDRIKHMLDTGKALRN